VRSVEIVLLLVVLATVVAASAHRLRIPAPSLLVLAGLLVALIPGVPAVQVAPDVVSLVVLPPLLYAAGQDLPLRELRPVWRSVAVLALGLVVASAAAVGFVAVRIGGLTTTMAVVLGTILASTDPVAVTALGRRLPLPVRLRTLIQAESLFNDATSLVLFRVAVTLAVAGGAVPWGRAGLQFLFVAGGGAAVGTAVAGGVVLIRRRTEDPVVETVIALVTPYAAYVLAESFRLSGVTAVVVASVLLAGQHTALTNAPIRIQVRAVYDTITFLLEGVVFSLIGLQLPGLVRAVDGDPWRTAWHALAITATLLAVRAIWVFPLSIALQLRRGGRPSWPVPAVVSWAGARGVIPLAAALSIPLVTRAGVALPDRDVVLLITTAVITITLVVQGLTLGPLVRWSGVAVPPEHGRAELAGAQQAMSRAALEYLDTVDRERVAPAELVARLRQVVGTRNQEPGGDADGGADHGAAALLHRLHREVIAVQAAELTRLYQDGSISASTRRRLQRRLDLEETSLGDA
jgi:monovalent cation/hydrogen antiporter